LTPLFFALLPRRLAADEEGPPRPAPPATISSAAGASFSGSLAA